MKRCAAFASICGALFLGGCTRFGRVEQGRVIAYDKQAQRVTLIRMPAAPGSGLGLLPPATITTPQDPSEMGPAPVSGCLLSVDSKTRSMVIYDVSSRSFRNIAYTPLVERHNVTKNPGAPVVDRIKKTITIYSPEDRALITFPASPELMAMPANTWRVGDVVRYYYKDQSHALRLMNVTRTDLSKSSG